MISLLVFRATHFLFVMSAILDMLINKYDYRIQIINDDRIPQ